MRFSSTTIGLLVCLGSTVPSAAELPDTIARVRPSVVAIGTVLPTRRPPNGFLGTGFVVDDGRHVVTNMHVVPTALDLSHKEQLAIFVPHPENSETRQARLVASDPKHDLALLSFDGEPLPTLELGDASSVREGASYAFTGFPIGMVLGLHPVTHRAMVSAITPIAIPTASARLLTAEMIAHMRSPFEVFQLDATAYPGNSGSPLYELQSGEVVAVLNMVFVKESKEHILREPSGITYAIPVSHVRKLLTTAHAESRRKHAGPDTSRE